MPDNKVSLKMTKEERDDILAAIGLLEEKLKKFFIELPANERDSLKRVGETNLGFIAKSVEVARQFPGILARDFDLEELFNDYELIDSLFAVRLKLNGVAQRVEDVYLAAGHDCYDAALDVYASVRLNRANNSELNGPAEELKSRFKRSSRRSSQPPSDK